MSNPARATDTSVTFSLAELTRLEDERIAAERAARAADRAARERARRRAEEERLRVEQEEAEKAAALALRTEHERARVAARLEAERQAALDVARIGAEARAKLDADNAARAHELALITARTTAGRRRLTRVLGAALALVVVSGAAAVYDTSRSLAAAQRESDAMRGANAALVRERDSAKSAQLATLDRRHEDLRARPHAKEATDALKTAAAARRALESGGEHGHLRTFADALDALEASLAARERLELLAQRHADLDAWASTTRRLDAAAVAKEASERAKGGDPGAVRAYELALDRYRDGLGQRTGATSRPSGGSQPVAAVQPERRCVAGDPGCGLDGRPLF